MKKNGRFKDWVTEFVDYRRQLGYQIRDTERYLQNLANFMDRKANGQSLTDVWVLRWRETNYPRSPRCLHSLGQFVPWLTLRDPKTTVSAILLRRGNESRPTPYIYESEEVFALMDATGRLSSYGRGLRRHTYGALLGLQASTGLRISESLGLDRDDVDWKAGVLRIRESKGVRLRMVPLHESTLEALLRYAKRRDSEYPMPQTKAFFVGVQGRGRLHYVTFRNTFQTMLKIAGVPFRPHPRPPRIHDLRHTFATRHLLRIRREGGDMHCAVADLSVYLGHREIGDTYWYLTGIPELMALCGERFQSHVETRRREGRP